MMENPKDKILSIDFEKAFDSVDRERLRKMPESRNRAKETLLWEVEVPTQTVVGRVVKVHKAHTSPIAG